MHSFQAKRSCMLFFGAILLITGLCPTSVHAQKDSADIPTVSTTYAIEGARIVQAPGRVIDSGTIVFRDGVIESVGRRATVPYDAIIIDGSGMTVYAGFIDALSRVGVAAPERTPMAPVADTSNPTYERAGITPEKQVRTLLNPSDKSVDAHRKLGFTTVHTVPHGNMLPGSGAVALLHGKNADAMIIRNDVSMAFQFSGARGVYPGTPMGIMAKFRQLHKESSRRLRLEQMYASDPAGMARPPADIVHTAFFPVIADEKPVFAHTTNALEVYRALTLKTELGLTMVLTGLSEGFDTIDTIKTSGNPVALTMGLPDKPKWAAEIKSDSLDQILASYTDETRTATFRDVEAEKRNLEAKQLVTRQKYVEMPKMYAEAGIPFAFTSYGVDSKDLSTNLKSFVEGGLSSDAALAALTVNAANILGLSASMGTLDAGKMANVIVTSGALFEDDTTIKYVFVDGHKFEYDTKTKKDDAPSSRRRGQ